MSCAVPGMKRSIFGSCRSIFISPLPPAAALAIAAQLLQQGDGAERLAAHVELADARQLDDLGRRHAADHRVAVVAPRLQRRQHGADVVVEEQHRGDDDVAAGDVGLAALERCVVGAPFVGGVHRERQPGKSFRNSACARAAAPDR